MDRQDTDTNKSLEKDQLTLLLQASELLSSSLDMQEILDRLMDQVIEVIKAKRGFIMMREQEDSGWTFRSARAIDNGALDQENFQISKSVIERVASEGRAILTSDATQDRRFKGQTSIALFDLKSILCAPLIIQGRVLGVIYADHQMETYVFGQKEKALLESIARQAAIALENARLYEELKQVHEESMEKARKELAETQAQLFQSSKMAAIGQLAAGIAHEINNPLGAIALNITSLKKYTFEERIQKRLEIIENASVKCKGIVEKLLRFSHPASGTLERVDICELILNTLQLIEHQLTKETIDIQKSLTERLYLMGDSGELSQVIMNIVLNSRDALRAVPKDQKRLIAIKNYLKENMVIVEITDNGQGMEESVRERIFEPFFTTKNVGEGVGLGLSVSFQIVKKYGGEIRVASAPGQGTTFLLCFPPAR